MTGLPIARLMFVSRPCTPMRSWLKGQYPLFSLRGTIIEVFNA